MAYSKQKVNDLFSKIIAEIDISDEMFTKAKQEYEALGVWIQKASDEYDVTIYPQGSFALGTVVKPISGKDDYDLDLVCELDQQYGLTAKQLKKDVVWQWLVDYRRITGEIINKRKCWHVEYEEVPNFHMDVIPAYDPDLPSIKMITEHNEDQDTYSYVGSNPSGYVDWFYSKCQVRWDALFEEYAKANNLRFDQVEIERLDRHKVKTPLQKAIQLLKRHRDMMFKDHLEDKPVSVIVTTIAAQLYDNEDNVVDTLFSFLNGAEEYINRNRINGKYYIENPSFPGENFADKWIEHPERATVFFKWLKQAQDDFDFESLMQMDLVSMGKRMKQLFGDATIKRVFTSIGMSTTAGITSGTTKVSGTTGGLSTTGTISIPSNHHYHGKISEE